MANTEGAVTVLDDSAAWDLLGGVSLGRLVTALGGQLEIFPVNFVVQDHSVLFRTSEGTKLFSTVMSDQVLFEADDHTARRGLERDPARRCPRAEYQRRDSRRRAHQPDPVGGD
jgi:hypothetical protein